MCVCTHGPAAQIGRVGWAMEGSGLFIYIQAASSLHWLQWSTVRTQRVGPVVMAFISAQAQGNLVSVSIASQGSWEPRVSLTALHASPQCCVRLCVAARGMPWCLTETGRGGYIPSIGRGDVGICLRQ